MTLIAATDGSATPTPEGAASACVASAGARPGVELLARLLAGERPAEAVDWIADALARWLRAEGEVGLTACLGLPGGTAQARRAVRDYYLTRAARMLPGPDWERAVELRRALLAFERRRWPHWRGRSDLPAEATAMEAALWRALRAWGDWPRSPHGLFAAIGGSAAARPARRVAA